MDDPSAALAAVYLGEDVTGARHRVANVTDAVPKDVSSVRSGDEGERPLAANEICQSRPAHPSMAAEEARRRTFRDWPPAMPQRPEDLVQAGFFYLGRGDYVQCYHCEGGLKSWDKDDDPFEVRKVFIVAAPK